MKKAFAIDPGISKCGIVIADLEKKIVHEALVLNSDLLFEYSKKTFLREKNIQFLIGNGTSSKKHLSDLKKFASEVINEGNTKTTFK